MKRSAELLGGLSITLTMTAVVGWMFCLAKLNTDFTVMQIAYVPLAAAAALAFFVNTALMRRGVPVPLYVAVQLVMMAGAIFLFLRCVELEPYRLRTAVIFCILYCLLFPITGFVANEAPTKGGLITAFDALTVLLAILLFLDNYLELPALDPTVVLCGAALALTLAALIAERVGRFHAGTAAVEGSKTAGRIMLGAMFAAVVGLTAAIATLAGSGIRRVSELAAAALKWIADTALAVLRFLYRLLDAIFTWLASLFPVTEEADAAPMGGAAGDVVMDIGEVDAVLPGWLKITAIALAAALLVYIIIRLRHHRFARIQNRPVRHRTAAKRSSAASSALKALVTAFFVSVAYRVNCVRFRRTAPGLLAWCERHVPKEQRRRKGESGEAFLLRLADAPERAPLRELANAVERSFYAQQSAPVSQELYRSIRKLKFT